MIAIPTLVDPGAEELARATSGLTLPARITGAMSGWRARDAWTPAELSRRVGDREVIAFRSPEPVFASSPIFGPLFDSEATTIAGFFAALAEPPPWRNLQAIPIRAQLPELWSDLALPRFIDPARLADAFLWIGQHGQATALHYDAMDNLNAVVRGGKRFTLFSPEDTGLLYHCPLDAPRPGAYYSLVDPRAPDLQRYPRFADAAPVEVALAAGEMLFLPAFWWHQVESVGESFAVSFWSRLCEPALERRLSAAMGALDAVAKELPAAWRRHLLRLCRDLVLADPPDD